MARTFSRSAAAGAGAALFSARTGLPEPDAFDQALPCWSKPPVAYVRLGGERVSGSSAGSVGVVQFNEWSVRGSRDWGVNASALVPVGLTTTVGGVGGGTTMVSKAAACPASTAVGIGD